MQTGTTDALIDLAMEWGRMGNFLTKQGRGEEAGQYYQKFLEMSETIYQQTGTSKALELVIGALDKIGDNRYAIGLYDEARTHRLKAWELFEHYVNLDPSAERLTKYFRDKAMQNGTSGIISSLKKILFKKRED